VRTVSIIVPTFNGALRIRRTVESLLAQDHPDFEVIVCNNASTDNTADVLNAYAGHPNIRVLFESRLGVHFARNTAALHACGEVLYFTDDDMVATPNLLSELVKAFDLHPEVGTATGRVLPQWEVEPPPWVRKYLSNSLLSLSDPPEPLIISSSDCGVFSCHQAILKTVFLKTGGFHPENTAGIWLGDGETGLNQEIVAMGYRTAFIGTSVTYHVIPVERMTQAYLNTRLRNQGRADGYTLMRTKRAQVSVGAEVLRSLGTFTMECATGLVHSVRDVHRLRLVLGMAHYHVARIAFLRRVQSDADFRTMVMKEDWLR